MTAPAVGQFCETHFSWLCQAGQGQCGPGDEQGLCDGCGEHHRDVETCHCSITRCPTCREDGCPRCDPHWTQNAWPGGNE